MNKEDTLPISLELAAVIQEQQSYIRSNLGQEYEYLFCGREGNKPEKFIPKPAVMKVQSFVRFLKNLAKEFDIRDNSGKSWNFQTHQFRHTVGTRMINMGVPLHIVQRYLGHESPEMTMRYAYIHDQTLKQEIASFQGKVVNIAGQVMKSENREIDHDADLQWFSRKVLAQALPNGSCTRPVLKGPCPHANTCLTCGDFRTTKEFLVQHGESKAPIIWDTGVK